MTDEERPDYITLPAAAALYGFRGDMSLRKAAGEGRLRVVRFGPRAIMTTALWVAEYEGTLRKSGRPRGSRRR